MRRFATVILVDPAGRVLLQERDEHPRIDPDTWSLCGGHVEDGEDVEVAAYRELEEETGLRLAPGTLRHWRTLQVFHAAYDSTDPVHVFVAGTELTDDDVVCHEGRQIVFVAPDDTTGLRFSQTGRQAVPDFLASDAYRHARFEAMGRGRVALVALVDRHGRILLQERDEHARVAPEQWTFPGGGLEDGETYAEAARRELAEETGVVLAPDVLEPVGRYSLPLDDDGPAADVELWAAAADLGDDDVACHEGRQMTFVDPDAARRLDLARVMARALPDLLTSDLYRELHP